MITLFGHFHFPSSTPSSMLNSLRLVKSGFSSSELFLVGHPSKMKHSTRERIESLLVHSLMWLLCTGVPSRCSIKKIVSPGTGSD